ncbi:AsmA family protein [Acidisoma cellulosilytica]|uniref:AsmA family protein n=1 Tax=Acidisoma cellulosilyticum TaxID=2802395 RepID=A0A964E4U3_9PROT|nr:AsmA family protein [Acidisoma cellulosilyticum]MCB8882000.1 AsmA family protein [Acidisoma cellulosilyticum]
MTRRGGTKLGLFLGLPVLVIVLVILFWNWDWFIPIVESQASAQIGRPVTIAHLHVKLGRTTRIVADDVVVANPKDFPGDVPPLARIAHLGIDLDVMAYIHDRIISVPLIDVNGPQMEVRGLPDGRNNYTLAMKKAAPPKPGQKPSPAPKLGDLTIENGQIHAQIAKMRTDFTANLETKPAEGVVAAQGQTTELSAEAKGTYTGQPITASLVTGALLTVTDATKPFPLSLKIANGLTHVSLAGTIQDPLAFAGTDLDLVLSGANMADLYHLTSIPIPDTPPYKISGKLNYETATQRIRFDNFRGVVGHTDVEGTITEQPQAKKPDVTMALASRNVDLADLAGFLGGKPGSGTAKTARPAAASGRILPTTPINLPKLNAANIHLTYDGHHIEGRSIPLDSLIVTMDLVDGAITLHPIILTIGKGRVQGDISVAPASESRVALKADVHFDNVDLSRIMASTHAFKGAGAIGGRATIDGTGNSVATLLGDGNGGLALYMAGGNLSALLIDLSGLEFGKAILSALGVPSQTNVDCMITDFALNHGLVTTRAMLVDTGEALIGGSGTANLATEALKFEIETRSKHFSVGNLPAPIEIGGTFGKPSIGIGIKPLVARSGIAVALGFLAAPLAILPTIDLGVGDPHKCGELVAEVKSQVARGKPGQAVPGAKVKGLPASKN